MSTDLSAIDGDIQCGKETLVADLMRIVCDVGTLLKQRISSISGELVLPSFRYLTRRTSPVP